MKTLLTFLILLSSYSNSQKNQNYRVEFIKIKHTGMEEKPIKALIISTSKVNLDIKGDDVYKIINTKKPLTDAQKDIFLNMRYNFIITNSKSYQLIIDFVNNNHSFFTNSINKNHGDYMDYSITVEGEVHNIYYKKKDLFFSKLVTCISAKNGDKSLVKMLSTY